MIGMLKETVQLIEM